MSFRRNAATIMVAVLLCGFGAVTGIGAGISQAAPDGGEESGPLKFELTRGSVTPKRAVPESVDPQKIVFRFAASRSTRVEARIVNLGKHRVVKRLGLGLLRPGRWHRVNWNGLDGQGRLVGAGKYRVLIGPSGSRLERLSRFELFGNRYPIAGPHGTRGAVGEFGAGRNGGRIHEGFDATGACGTPLVAMRSGTILKSAYDAALKGHYVVYKGRSERRTYLYAHLERQAPVRVGQKVRAGRRLGTIGQTGNAAGTPCHLHIEIRSRGRLLDPKPVLASALG
jgi:murein DD-endopeptidase MepM/ murein hydrolase activator NlpD